MGEDALGTKLEHGGGPVRRAVPLRPFAVAALANGGERGPSWIATGPSTVVGAVLAAPAGEDDERSQGVSRRFARRRPSTLPIQSAPSASEKATGVAWARPSGREVASTP